MSQNRDKYVSLLEKMSISWNKCLSLGTNVYLFCAHCHLTTKDLSSALNMSLGVLASWCLTLIAQKDSGRCPASPVDVEFIVIDKRRQLFFTDFVGFKRKRGVDLDLRRDSRGFG